MLTLSALLLGVTVVTPAPLPPEPATSDMVAPHFDAPRPDVRPPARRRSELRDPFASRHVAAPPRRRSELLDPFAARNGTGTTIRSPDIKAPF